MKLDLSLNEYLASLGARITREIDASADTEHSILVVDSVDDSREALALYLEYKLPSFKVYRLPQASDVDMAMERRADALILHIHGAAVGSPLIREQIAVLCAGTADRPLLVVGDQDTREDVETALRLGARAYVPSSSRITLLLNAVQIVRNGGIYAPPAFFFAPLIECDNPAAPPSAPHRGGERRRAEERPCLPSPHPATVATAPPAEPGVTPAALAEQPIDSAQPHSPAAPRPRAEPWHPGTEDRAVERTAGSFSPRQRQVLELLRQGLQNKLIAHRLGITESTVKVHLRAIMRKLGLSSRTQVALMTSHLFSAEEGDGQAARHAPTDTDRSVDTTKDGYDPGSDAERISTFQRVDLS